MAAQSHNTTTWAPQTPASAALTALVGRLRYGARSINDAAARLAAGKDMLAAADVIERLLADMPTDLVAVAAKVVVLGHHGYDALPAEGRDQGLRSSTPETMLERIRHEYRPYDSMPEFQEGFAAHSKRHRRNPYPSSVAAQAWDRGLKAATRYARALDAAQRGAVVEAARSPRGYRRHPQRRR